MTGAFIETVKAVGEGNSNGLTSAAGMGVWRAMAGCESFQLTLALQRVYELTMLATALYVLTLGVLGFIPMPAKVSVGKKKQ